MAADGGLTVLAAECGRTNDDLRLSDIDIAPFSKAFSTRLLGVVLSRQDAILGAAEDSRTRVVCRM